MRPRRAGRRAGRRPSRRARAEDAGRMAKVAGRRPDRRCACCRDEGRRIGGAADLSLRQYRRRSHRPRPRADGTVTYGQIFALEPFGNNLVVMTLTGAQLKALLEQQFEDASGNGAIAALDARAVGGLPLRLRPVAPAGSRIVGMTLERQADRPERPLSSDASTISSQRAATAIRCLPQGTDAFDGGARSRRAGGVARRPIRRCRRVERIRDLTPR